MGRGGAREGAGRPANRAGQKAVTIRLMPEYHERLMQMAKESKVSIGRMIEMLIDSWK
jgi:predicted HicB family RNase H-like nuclease